MALNLESLKWTKIFRGEVIEWPDLLHKETWDKKKGKVLAAIEVHWDRRQP